MIGEDGCLLEGLSSNFFAIKDGAIYTAEAGVLSGITRSMVLNAISEKHLPLCLQGICVSDIGKLNEAFLTSASRGILPIVAIDNQPVGDGHPGPITRLLMDGYEELVNQNLETI
jgi:branched-subunit amino acid aminotransferase/4-amino-4-deoxychorismate lyase